MLLWRFPKRLRHVADQVASAIYHATQKVCRLFGLFAVLYILYSLERIFYPTTIRRAEHNLYSNTVAFFRSRQRVDETKARVTLRVLIRCNRIPIIFFKGKLTTSNRVNLTLFAKEVRIFYFLETRRRISCRNRLLNRLCKDRRNRCIILDKAIMRHNLETDMFLTIETRLQPLS